MFARNKVHFICVKKTIGLIALFFLSCNIFAGEIHTGKVKYIQSADGRPCTFFQLVGVDVADAAVSPSPWFAVINTHNGQKEIVSILLAASATGRTITTGTAGGGIAGCSNFAEVNWVRQNPQ